jgi:hypothetical protein
MKSGFMTYLAAAFNARPLGMPVPPNWLCLAAVGLLGVLAHGVWLIGAGLELGYLLALVTNERFRAVVDASASASESGAWAGRRAELVARLTPELRRAQEALEERCRGVLSQGADGVAAEIGGQQAESLAQLAWIHLRLLLSRQRVGQVVADAEAPAVMAKRIGELEAKLADAALSKELRASLASQLEILTSRRASQASASERLALIDAELERLRQQVELVREQSALSSDAGDASRAINALGATLGETSRWLSDQRQALGELEDLSAAPPSAALFGARPPRSAQSA